MTCGVCCCIYLGTTDDGGERAFGHIYSALEIVQFLLQEETSHRGLEKCSHTCQERVRALMWVHGCKDVKVGELGRSSNQVNVCDVCNAHIHQEGVLIWQLQNGSEVVYTWGNDMMVDNLPSVDPWARWAVPKASFTYKSALAVTRERNKEITQSVEGEWRRD